MDRDRLYIYAGLTKALEILDWWAKWIEYEILERGWQT